MFVAVTLVAGLGAFGVEIWRWRTQKQALASILYYSGASCRAQLRGPRTLKDDVTSAEELRVFDQVIAIDGWRFAIGLGEGQVERAMMDLPYLERATFVPYNLGQPNLAFMLEIQRDYPSVDVRPADVNEVWESNICMNKAVFEADRRHYFERRRPLGLPIVLER